jgi:hypothetical protein
MGQCDSEVTHQVSEAMNTVGQGSLGAIYSVGIARVSLLLPSDISVLCHEHYITNISEKYSPLYVLMSFQNYFGFLRTLTFRDI